MRSKTVLLEDDSLIADSSSVAEVFNEYICDVAGSTGDILKIDDFKNHPSIQSITENINVSTFTFFFLFQLRQIISWINLILKK